MISFSGSRQSPKELRTLICGWRTLPEVQTFDIIVYKSYRFEKSVKRTGF